MPVFTVHEPPPREGDDAAAATDRFVFVRDRFSIWAFLFGPLWMIWRRLWLVLLIYLVAMAALQAPVIISPSGLGAFSDEHPLAYNILCGQDIWDDIDVALVIGTRFIAPALAWGRQNEVAVLRIDIDPQQIRKPRPPVHALVIPKRHITTLNDIGPADAGLLGHMVVTAQQIAAQDGIDETGFRLVMNCNRDGGQTVYHIHMHILGGRSMHWPPG